MNLRHSSIEMKKFALSLFAVLSLSVVSVGCGGNDVTVIDAPANDTPERSASEQADYDKKMEEQMSQQGN